jgi:hypothetical protein
MILPLSSRQSGSAVGWFAFAMALVLATLLSATPSAQAQDQDQDATKILKAMTDYVASQKVISATYDSDIEVITNKLQKIQFASSGQMLLSRPDKARVSRLGGYVDAELVFDGKTLSVLGKNLNAYAQTDATASVDQLVARLRDEFGVPIPGADLLLSGAYDEMMMDVLDAKHIGRGVIDGVECDHLAFRNNDVDWQIWIQLGSRPIPRQYVITNKAVAAAPQYTLRIKEWKTDVQVPADAFAFKPPADAKKVDIMALSGIDEVPPGAAPGEKK